MDIAPSTNSKLQNDLINAVGVQGERDIQAYLKVVNFRICISNPCKVACIFHEVSPTNLLVPVVVLHLVYNRSVNSFKF